jgi:hypothetical protein
MRQTVGRNGAETMNSPEARQIRMLERSLDCFRSGLIGLAPVVGVPWSVGAVRGYVHARAAGRGLWNPAAKLALSGFILGLFGMLWFALQILAVAGIAVAIARGQ